MTSSHEAEEQTRFAETFVGMLGHDLRNPLNAINDDDPAPAADRDSAQPD